MAKELNNCERQYRKTIGDIGLSLLMFLFLFYVGNFFLDIYINLVVYFALPNLLLNIYTFYMIFIITKAIIEPVIVEYLNEHKNIQSGILMGLRQSFISLGGIVGVLIGGVIYANNNVMLFYICSVMLFIASIVSIIIYILKRRDSKN